MMIQNKSRKSLLIAILSAGITTSRAFTTSSGFSSPKAFVHSHQNDMAKFRTTALPMTIVSPFDNGEAGETSTATADPVSLEGPLDLTWENVEAVLDTMREYLIQDGGNVAIKEIDGPIVRLELQGACGTCPSSTQTLKMGLERGLKEKIPEIQEVIQAMPEGPPLELEQVDVVLDGVRPFLQVAGGEINCLSITGEGSIRPVILLKMEGASASLKSVKLEIQQRLQRHFMLAGLVVEWDE